MFHYPLIHLKNVIVYTFKGIHCSKMLIHITFQFTHHKFQDNNIVSFDANIAHRSHTDVTEATGNLDLQRDYTFGY